MKSISKKVGLGYFVLIIINIAISIFAIYHIYQLGSPVDRILKEKYQNVSAADNMIQSLNQQELINQALFEEGYDSTLVNNFHTYKNEFLNWHQQAISGIALPSEPDILDSIMSNFQQYLAKSDTLHLILKKQISIRSIQFYHHQQVEPIVQNLKKFVGDLRHVNEKAIKDADERAKSFSSRATLLIILFAGLAIVLSVYASFYFAKSILRPIKDTTNTVKKIGQGHLNQKVNITTNDEIAELGVEFNKMTERLEEYEKMNLDQILLEKKKSESIVAGIPVAIIVTNQEREITLMNELATKILDIKEDSWETKSVKDVVKDERLLKLLTEIKSSDKPEGELYKSLITLKQKENDLHFLARQIDIMVEGKVMGMVTLLQDVTSFKNLDRLKSDFMSTISHEFRTPLTSMNMTIDILLKEVQGKINKNQRELLSDAKKDGQRLKKLVKDLLELSKFESGKFDYSIQFVDFKELVNNAIFPLRLNIEEKKIELDITIDSDLPDIQADFHHLSRVVTNLVENAIQHTPTGGKIKIRANRDKNYLKVCVSDNGEGIPEEAIDFIFDKFVQTKNFKDIESGNIGLGLAIAKEIIKGHGGKIWVESKIHQGSKFCFTIPFDIMV